MKSDRKRRNRSFLIAASEDIACDTYIWRLCLLASVAQLSILPFLDHDWKRRIVLDLKPLPSQWCGIVEKSLRNRSNWPNCGRRKKGEANNRIRPLGSKRTEELKLRQAREANNFCLRWTASRDRVRFQIVGVKVVVAFVAGAPFSSTVSNVAIRGRGELILSAQKSPASKPVEEKQRERKRNGRRNPTIRYFASLARPLVYPWKPRKISYRIFDGILPYRSSFLSFSLLLQCRNNEETEGRWSNEKKYVGDQISSNAARLLARVYLSGDRPSENRMKGKGCARITCLRTRSDAFKTIRPLFCRWEKKYLLSTIESWRHSRGSIHGKYLPANLPPPPLQPSIKHSKNKFPLDQGGNFCCVDFSLRSRWNLPSFVETFNF